MTRDRIKSRASLKGEVWLGRRKSVEYGGKETPWPSSHDADSENSEPVSREEFGFVMVASDTASSGSPVLGLVAIDSLAGLEILSSDLVISTTQPSSCRRCWASKCRGLYDSSKFPSSG